MVEEKFLGAMERQQNRMKGEESSDVDIQTRARSLLNREQYEDKKIGQFQKLMSSKDQGEAAEAMGAKDA